MGPDKGGVAPGLLVLTVAEDTGGALGEGLLPSLNLAGVDLVPGGQLGHRFLAPHRLQCHLGLESRAVFLRPWDISHSFLAATAALSLGADSRLVTCPVSWVHLSRYRYPVVGLSEVRKSCEDHIPGVVYVMAFAEEEGCWQGEPPGRAFQVILQGANKSYNGSYWPTRNNEGITCEERP